MGWYARYAENGTQLEQANKFGNFPFRHLFEIDLSYQSMPSTFGRRSIVQSTHDCTTWKRSAKCSNLVFGYFLWCFFCRRTSFILRLKQRSCSFELWSFYCPENCFDTSQSIPNKFIRFNRYIHRGSFAILYGFLLNSILTTKLFTTLSTFAQNLEIFWNEFSDCGEWMISVVFDVVHLAGITSKC